MSGTYAEGTSVAPERSQMEIAALVRKYGASSFATGWDGPRALVTFVAHRRTIRFVLALPDDPNAAPFRYVKVNAQGQRERSPAQRTAALEAEVRRLWRALLLTIKAKFEAIESGIVTFEDEFLPHTVLPDGTTVADSIRPRVEQAIAAGTMPTTLLAIEGSHR
jgi:hypothetical protein